MVLRQPKELHIIDGGTHFDFYDRQRYVGPTITKINEFFTNHLYPDGRGQAPHPPAGRAGRERPSEPVAGHSL